MSVVEVPHDVGKSRLQLVASGVGELGVGE